MSIIPFLTYAPPTVPAAWESVFCIMAPQPSQSRLLGLDTWAVYLSWHFDREITKSLVHLAQKLKLRRKKSHSEDQCFSNCDMYRHSQGFLLKGWIWISNKFPSFQCCWSADQSMGNKAIEGLTEALRLLQQLTVTGHRNHSEGRKTGWQHKEKQQPVEWFWVTPRAFHYSEEWGLEPATALHPSLWSQTLLWVSFLNSIKWHIYP